MNRTIRIGTRGSRLALAQSRAFGTALEQAVPGITCELVIIKTSGDLFVDRPLRDIGGKGLFVKEIEQALLEKRVDLAVHSMKDLPSELAPGLVLAAVPPREQPHDVLITRSGVALAELPHGARVGTSSTRRRAFCKNLRPDLQLEELRGNVDTRLAKLEAGDVDAILLAAAGLRRLGLAPHGLVALDPTTFIPAIGQGALAIETRDEISSAALVGVLDDADTRTCTAAERAVLAAVGGSCHTPIAAHAQLAAGELHLRAVIAHPDGSAIVTGERRGTAAEASEIGAGLAAELLDRGGAEILGSIDAG